MRGCRVKEGVRVAGDTRLVSAWPIAALALALVVGGLLTGCAGGSSARARASLTLTSGLRKTQTWLEGTDDTEPSFTYTPDAADPIAVDGAFQAYYTAHAGKATLGDPITPAFLTQQGWAQFFADDVLLLPQRAPAGAQTSGGSVPLSDALIRDGARDDATGVIRLPLLDALLQSGSAAPVGGATTALTYAALRADAQVNTLIVAPSGATQARDTAQALPTQDGYFIAEGARDGKAVGRDIPSAVWSAITSASFSPDGWQADLGLPLTAALSLTGGEGAGADQAADLVAQAFQDGIVIVDLTHGGAQRASVGLDYLRTFGPPPTALTANTPVWSAGATTLYNAPTTGDATLHVGQNFPLALTGETRWSSAGLSYQVTWKSPSANGTGWVAAGAITFQAPDQRAPAYASFDALSPDLQRYLNTLGSQVGVAVFDLTRNVYYTYNEQAGFTTASSVKVPILLALLSQTESQGREPDDDEMALLTAMIEHSDNDAAQTLFEEIGGAGPLDAFMAQQGVSGFQADPDAWGYSAITPLAMTQVLTRLQRGQMLTPADCQLALSLLSNVEADQQIGVGSTAPGGAQVALKDGWVQDASGLWVANSSGVVTVGKETYVISVYTQGDDNLDTNWGVVEHVCAQVAQALTAG